MKTKFKAGDKVICKVGTKDDSEYALRKGEIYTIARYDDCNGDPRGDMVALREKGDGYGEIYFAKRFKLVEGK